MKLNRDRLKASRQAKGWRQEDLARRAGLSLSYIKLLEGGQRGRSTLTAETIARLEAALDLPPGELVAGDLSPQGERLLSRLQTIQAAAGAPAWAIATDSASIDDLLAQSLRMSWAGKWEAAFTSADRARGLCVQDPTQWADITLRYCANYRQEAGRIDLALQETYHGWTRYSSLIDQPEPRIEALFYARLAWIEAQLRGRFKEARTWFDKALPLAQEAGDAYLVSQCLHRMVRLDSEEALLRIARRYGKEWWLGACAPFTDDLPLAVRRELARDLQDRLAAATALDPLNIHHHHRAIIIQSLMEARNAADRVQREAQRKFVESPHLLALQRARMALSEEEWKDAIRAAEEALEAFVSRRHLPVGITEVTACLAFSERRYGLETMTQLDRWVLVLLLHPYETHPLFRLAAGELVSALHAIAPEERSRFWMGLNERVWTVSGVFAAVREITVPLAPFPDAFVRGHLKALARK